MGFIQAETLVGLLRWRAYRQADRPAYVYLAGGEKETIRLTYGELDRYVRSLAARLQILGGSGERVLLLLPSSMDFIVAFYACLYAGAVAVPCFPPRPNRPVPRIQAIVADAQARFALTTAEVTANLERRFSHLPDLRSLQWLAVDQSAPDEPDLWKEPELSGDQLAFLQYTSGSTASPKGVMVSHHNILYNTLMLLKAYKTNEETIIVSWIPLFHDMGLIGGALHALRSGGGNVFMSPEVFLQRPVRWLEALTRYRGTFSGAPNFGYQLCVEKILPEQCQSLDLSSWRCTSVGAEPVRERTLRAFVDMFQPYGLRPDVFAPGFGLAEATLMVSSQSSGSKLMSSHFDKKCLENKRVVPATTDEGNNQTLVACGPTYLDEKVLIVDPETLTRCAPDQIGEIWVSGPNVALGYWFRPMETADTFWARLADTGEGPFLRTGDLGFFCEGNLYIAGRLKDLIIIEGINYYPQDIELSVEECHSALRKNCNAAFSAEMDGTERVVIVQEVERAQRKNLDIGEILNQIQWVVAKDYGVRVYAIVLVEAMSIPKTTSGKIMRRACRAQYLEGTLKIMGQWQAPV